MTERIKYGGFQGDQTDRNPDEDTQIIEKQIELNGRADRDEYSLFARTTPARNVPSAGESPTTTMSNAMAMTSSNAVAVNSSRNRVTATKRNIGRIR